MIDTFPEGDDPGTVQVECRVAATHLYEGVPTCAEHAKDLIAEGFEVIALFTEAEAADLAPYPLDTDGFAALRRWHRAHIRGDYDAGQSIRAHATVPSLIEMAEEAVRLRAWRAEPFDDEALREAIREHGAVVVCSMLARDLQDARANHETVCARKDADLAELTACTCGEAYTSRGLKAPDCNHDSGGEIGTR